MIGLALDFTICVVLKLIPVVFTLQHSYLLFSECIWPFVHEIHAELTIHCIIVSFRLTFANIKTHLYSLESDFLWLNWKIAVGLKINVIIIQHKLVGSASSSLLRITLYILQFYSFFRWWKTVNILIHNGGSEESLFKKKKEKDSEYRVSFCIYDDIFLTYSTVQVSSHPSLPPPTRLCFW